MSGILSLVEVLGGSGLSRQKDTGRLTQCEMGKVFEEELGLKMKGAGRHVDRCSSRAIWGSLPISSRPKDIIHISWPQGWNNRTLHPKPSLLLPSSRGYAATTISPSLLPAGIPPDLLATLLEKKKPPNVKFIVCLARYAIENLLENAY